MNGPFKISPDVSFRQVGDELFILHRNSSSVYNINSTAVFIWNSIREGKTKDVIVSELCEHFTIDAATATKDTVELINQLSENKIVLSL